MKNEYDVAVGQVKAIESEVHHAKGSEPCVYLVRLEAEGLSDGSAVLNVACYLKSGGRTLRTWTWHTPEEQSKAIYAYLNRSLATRSMADTSWSFDFVQPDTVEDYGSLDVSEALGLMRDAYQRGLGTARDEKDAEFEKTLQGISDRSADIAYRHREERRAAYLEGNDTGRFEGTIKVARDLGYDVRVREDRFDVGRFEWSINTSLTGPKNLSIFNQGGYKTSDEAVEAAVQGVGQVLAARAKEERDLVTSLRDTIGRLQARERDLEATREATAQAYIRVNADNIDLRKRLQTQTRLCSEAQDARDRQEAKADRLEAEKGVLELDVESLTHRLERQAEVLTHQADLVEASLRAEVTSLRASLEARPKDQALRKANIRVDVQTTGKAQADVADETIWIAYLGTDPYGRAIAVIPMFEMSLVLRASLGDIWTEVK